MDMVRSSITQFSDSVYNTLCSKMSELKRAEFHFLILFALRQVKKFYQFISLGWDT